MLILDEPTNHLDIDSRAALIEAINDYGGAVILVSHDKYLLDACADRLWLVEGGTVTPFDGDSDDYTSYVLERAGRGNGRQKTKGNGNSRQTIPDRAERPFAKTNAAQLSKRISAIDGKIGKFRDLIARIDGTLADPAVFGKNPAKAALLSSQRGDLARLLAAAEEEWLDLADTLEGEPRSPRRPIKRGRTLMAYKLNHFPKSQPEQNQQRQQNKERENSGFSRKCDDVGARASNPGHWCRRRRFA